MRPRDRFLGCGRRVKVLQVGRDPGGDQVVVNGREPFRTFGMPGTHFMRGAGTVCEESCVQHVSFQPDFCDAPARYERLSQC